VLLRLLCFRRKPRKLQLPRVYPYPTIVHKVPEAMP
jgi:hypothetical protein